MKKVISLLLIVLLTVGTVPAFAQGGNWTEVKEPDYVRRLDKIQWNIDEEGTLTMESWESLMAYPYLWQYYGPWEGNKSIKRIIFPDSVTYIGDELFRNCTNLKEVVLPKNLKTLGNAFTNCSSLDTITISDEAQNFTVIDNVVFEKVAEKLVCYPKGKKNEEYTVPEGVKIIGENALRQATIKKLVLPKSIELLEEKAVAQYDEVYYNGTKEDWEKVNFTNYNDGLFENAFYVMENGVYTPFDTQVYRDYDYEKTTDGVKIKKYKGNAEHIAVPEKISGEQIKAIGYRAFGNTKAKSITIPEGVTTIDNHAFAGCESLERIVLPESLTSIGEGAFSACYALKEISLPKNLEVIGDRCFEYCHSLERIDAHAENKFFESDESGILYTKGRDKLICCPEAYKNLSTDNITWSFEEGVLTIDGVGGVGENATAPWHDAMEQSYGIPPIKWAETPTKKVIIGKDVTSVEYIVKSRNVTYEHIEAFEVHPENRFYTSIDGVLFNKDKTMLVRFPMGKKLEEYIVPDTVKEYGKTAFVKCNIDHLVLNDGVERLPSFDSAHIKKITMPQSVTQIDAVFSGTATRYDTSGLNSISEIVYTGTIKKWTDTKKFASYNIYELDYTSQGNLLDAAKKYYGDRFVYVDGRLVELTAPITQEYNKVMVPMRGVCEALGYSVTWNSEEGCAIAIKEGKEVKIPVLFQGADISEAYVNSKGVEVKTERAYISRGETYYKEIPHRAALENGITMISVKTIDDVFGVKIGWDETYDCMSFTTEGFSAIDAVKYIPNTEKITFTFNAERYINGYEGVVSNKEDIESILTIVSEMPILPDEEKNSWLPAGDWLSFTILGEDLEVYIAINHEDMLVKTLDNRGYYKIHDAKIFTQKLLPIFARNASVERAHLKYNRKQYSVTPYVIDNRHRITYEQLMVFINETQIKLQYSLEDGVLSMKNAYGKIQTITPFTAEDGGKYYSLKDITQFLMYHYSINEKTGFIEIRKPWNIP